MNEHQRRLWSRMVELIESYREGAMGYGDMVGQLEGTLDAGEFRDEELVREWYTFWGSLEEIRALQGQDVTENEVGEHLDSMRRFLVDHVEAPEE
jgi:hypothetical protein